MAENWTRMYAYFWMSILSCHREKWSWILHDTSVFDRWHRWPMAQSAWSLAEGLLGGSWSKVAWFLAGYEWQLERTKTKYCTWHNETQLLWFSLFCKPPFNDMNSGKFLCPIQFIWLLQGSKIAFIWFFDAWFLFLFISIFHPLLTDSHHWTRNSLFRAPWVHRPVQWKCDSAPWGDGGRLLVRNERPKIQGGWSACGRMCWKACHMDVFLGGQV